MITRHFDSKNTVQRFAKSTLKQRKDRMVKRELHRRHLHFVAKTETCSSVNMTPNMNLLTLLQETGP